MLGFSAQMLLGFESFGKHTDFIFKCCDGKQVAIEFCTWLGYKEKTVVMQKAKGGTEGSQRAAALRTVIYKPQS